MGPILLQFTQYQIRLLKQIVQKHWSLGNKFPLNSTAAVRLVGLDG
jgi:hypothetical protein